MPKAVWNGAVIAESADTMMVEGSHYFPAASVDSALIADNSATSVGPWKGVSVES